MWEGLFHRSVSTNVLIPVHSMSLMPPKLKLGRAVGPSGWERQCAMHNLRALLKMRDL